MFDDDFDPEFHSAEEIEAHEADEQQVSEVAALFEELEQKQARMEQVAFEDPVGAVIFGEYPRTEDADKWWDRRLSGDAGEE